MTELGQILSLSSSRSAAMQFFQDKEKEIREGIMILVDSRIQNDPILGRITKITPYHEFYSQGDVWSQARREKIEFPQDLARQWLIAEIDLLQHVSGNRISFPPVPGSLVNFIPDGSRFKDIFPNIPEDGTIDYGTLIGYKTAKVPLLVEEFPLHLGIFGITGSGKSFDTGVLIEKLSSIEVKDSVHDTRKISYPMIIIDAHGDYTSYWEYFKKNGKLGSIGKVHRFVFPNVTIPNTEKLGINLEEMFERPTDLAELLVSFYRGSTEGADLSVHGLSRVLEDLRNDGYEIKNLFTTQFDTLRNVIQGLDNREFHTATKSAMIRAVRNFRDKIEDEHKLLSVIGSPMLESHFVDNLTKNGEMVIIDLSAEGAPGVDIKVKQFLMTFLAKLLFRKFAEYKVQHDQRYLLFMIEEAQNFVPAASYKVGSNLSKSVLSSIATQGRKFGLSLCLITQRPSFLDPIVLSMCNSFIIHRTAIEDTTYVTRAAGGLPEDIKQRLNHLSQGELVISGQINPLPFPLIVNIKFKDRMVPHVAGAIEVISTLSRLRGVNQ